MPELPEVETVVRGLRNGVIGRVFTGARVHWPREIVGLDPASFSDRLTGQRVQDLSRRGKYIVFTLTHDSLLIHLKMSGRLYLAAPGPAASEDRWVRVIFHLDSRHDLCFSDARKFGRVYLVSEASTVLGHLGPEPLSEAFTPAMFQQAMSRRRTPIKQLLLDQRFLAGVGNIYADEALWWARIAPHRLADTLNADESVRLYDAIRALLEEAITYEGTTISWYRKPDGSRGSYQNRFKVYDRAGQPCFNCGLPIVKTRLGQRGTHYCPACQR